jgi:hypothetical protein
MNLDPIRAAIAPYALLIKLGLVAVLAISMFIGGCNHGAAKWQGKYKAEVAERMYDQIEIETILEQHAENTRAADAKAKADSARAAADRKANDQRHKELTHEAAKARAALAAALRNGTARLRPEFACAAPGSAEGGTAAAAGGQDDQAGLRRAREEAISDDIADHDRADHWIGWLQADLIATRTACGVTP